MKLGIRLSVGLFASICVACADPEHRADQAGEPGASAAVSIATRSQEPDMVRNLPEASPDIDFIRQAVDSALGLERLGLTLSPALPMRWPAAHPQVVFFGYESEALPTGVIAYRISGPKVKVTITLPAGRAVVEKLSLSDVSGRETMAFDGVGDLGRAEQALLDVVAGSRTPESVKIELGAYSRWAARNKILGADARRRAREFFNWLDSGVPGTAR